MNITQSKPLSLPPTRRINAIKSLSFHPTHPYLTLSSRKSLHTFCIRTGARICSLNTESEILLVRYHDVSEMMVVAHRNGCVACYEMREHPVALARLRNFHVPSAQKEQFMAHLLCSKLRDGVIYSAQFKSSTVRCRDLHSGRKISDMVHKKIVTCMELAIEYGREYVITGCIDGSVRIWENGQVARHQFDVWGEKHKGRNPVSAICVASVNGVGRLSRASPSSMSSGSGAMGGGFGTTASASSGSLVAVATQYGIVQVWSVDFSIFISSCIGKIVLNRWVTSLQFHPTLPILFALTDKGAFIPIWIGDVLNQSGIAKGETIELYAFDMMDPLYVSVDDPDVGLSNQTAASLAAKYTANKYAAYCLPSVRFEMDPRTSSIAFYGKSFQLTPYASLTSNYQNFGCDVFPLFSVQDLNHPLSILPICSNHSTQMVLYLGEPVGDTGRSPSSGGTLQNETAEFRFPFSQVYYVDTLSERPNAVLMSKVISEENLCRVQSLRATSVQQQKEGVTEFYQCVHAAFSPSSNSMIIFYKLLQQKKHSMNSVDKRYANNQAKKATFSWKLFQIGKGESPLQHNGLDGTFLDDKEFLVLSEDGRFVSKFYDTQFVERFDILGGAAESDSSTEYTPSADTPLQSNNFSFEDLSSAGQMAAPPRLKSVQITRIFASPYDTSLLLYFDEMSNTLGMAHPPPSANSTDPDAASRQFQYDLTLPFLHMKLNEKVLSVVWQQDRMASGISADNTTATAPVMIGILTSHRVMITNQKLEILSQMEIATSYNSYNNTDYAYKHKYGTSNSKSNSFTYHSCLWVGNTLLFNDDRAVYALVVGRNEPIQVCSLDHDRAVLCAAFPDRLVLVSHHPDGERICTRYLNMGDLLIEGILGIAESKRAGTIAPRESPTSLGTSPQHRQLSSTSSTAFLIANVEALKQMYAFHSEEHIAQLLARVMERFDSRQIPEWALTRLLAQGYSQVCSSLLLATVNEYQWTSRFQVALKSMRLTEAFNTLRKQFLTEHIDGEFVPENSQYYLYFADLAERAMEHAQYNLAARCWYMIQDVWKLFSLFATLRLHQGLRFLSENTKNSTDLYSVHMACETLLERYSATGDDASHAVDNFERVLDSVTDEPLKTPPAPALPVATELRGIICTKKKSVSPTDMSNGSGGSHLSTAMQYDDMEPLKHNSDIATWLGFTDTKRPEMDSSAMDDASQGWGSQQTFDFQKSFEYNGADTASVASRMVRSDSAVSADEMSSRGTAASGSGAPDTEASETESVAESEKSNGNDASMDQDALRQKYLGGGDDESSSSNSEFSDSDDDRGYNSFKRKKKLFKTVRISDESVVSPQDAAPKTLNFGGTLTLSKQAPARRRRIGSVVPSGGATVEGAPRRSLPAVPSASQLTTKSSGKSKKQHGTSSATDPLTASLTAAECLKKATEFIDSKSYPQAKRYIVPAIQKLIADPQETLRKTHILLCVKYLLFTQVALGIGECMKKKASQEAVASVAACLFTASENLTPQHFFFCRNQCYKMNLQARNYGFAAFVLRSFIAKTPPKYRQQLEQHLETCKEHNYANRNPLLPSKDGDVLLFDWKTFELLDANSRYSSCEFCGATYKGEPSGVEDESKCDYCFYGSVQEVEK